QVHPDRAVRDRFARQLGVTDLFYPDRRLRAVGEKDGFPVLNLAPLLQAHSEKRQVFLHGYGNALGVGHWNAEGHAAAGRLIAEWVAGLLKERQGALDGRKSPGKSPTGNPALEPDAPKSVARDCQAEIVR